MAVIVDQLKNDDCSIFEWVECTCSSGRNFSQQSDNELTRAFAHYYTSLLDSSSVPVPVLGLGNETSSQRRRRIKSEESHSTISRASFSLLMPKLTSQPWEYNFHFRVILY